MAVVAAFQRHHRPAKVDGIADVSTVATLGALLAAREPRVNGASANGASTKSAPATATPAKGAA
jgi:N-acetylmuramoyl-L-alanine amidase